MAQVVAACELDPVTVRSGKEGLFKAPTYDSIFDGRSLQEYLAIYWLGRIVKRQGKGYPDRAYAKWHVLHFLWELVAPLLRSKRAAQYFRECCERNIWNPSLDRITSQVYLAHLDFFRKTRGKGVKAIDISNFFYRPNQEKQFEAYWKSRLNNRRVRTLKYLQRFEADLTAGASN